MHCLLVAMGIFASGGTILLLLGIAGIAAAIPAARPNPGAPQFASVAAPARHPKPCALAAAFLAQIVFTRGGPFAGAATCVCAHSCPAYRRPNDPK
jgi:hypothetical protein